MTAIQVAAPSEMEAHGGAPAPIAVESLTKRFGRMTAVDDLSFNIHSGKVTGFLGPNGAGKTTTLRMILGLARPTSGAALVLGHPYSDLEKPASALGALLDAATFHPRRTARNHLRWSAATAGVPVVRIDEVLQEVDLSADADRHVGEFSLGMRQRLALAVALLGEPRVLVLDEPANGLDPAGIRWLRIFLRDFSGRGGTVLVSSHLLAEIAQLADEVVVIDRGRLIAHTTVERLTAGAVGTTRVRTPSPAQLIPLLVAQGAEISAEGNGSLLEVRGVGPDHVGEIAASAGIVIHELGGGGAHSLEDVFFELTRKEEPHGSASQG